jgi:hypothetical protein
MRLLGGLQILTQQILDQLQFQRLRAGQWLFVKEAIDPSQASLQRRAPASLSRNDDPFLHLIRPAHMNRVQLPTPSKIRGQHSQAICIYGVPRLIGIGRYVGDIDFAKSPKWAAAEVLG